MSNSGPSRSGSLFLRTAAYSAIVTILTLTAFGLRFIMHEREVLFGHLQEHADTLLLAVDSLYAGAVAENDLPAAMEQASRIVRENKEVSYLVFTPAQGPSHVVTIDESKTLLYCRAPRFVKKRGEVIQLVCFTIGGQDDPPRTH